MYCTSCGQNNATEASFCASCDSPMAVRANGGQGSIPSRGVGQLVGHTFDVYRQNFWLFFLIALPGEVAHMVVLAAPSELSLVILVMYPLGWLIRLVAAGAAAHAVALQYLGEEIGLGESYRKAFSKSWILIVAAVLIFSGMAVAGLLMLIIIGVPLFLFLAVSWAFYTQAVMIEGDGPTSALRRSNTLVRGGRWRVLRIGITYLIILIGLTIAIVIPTNIMLFIGFYGQVLFSVALFAGVALVMPIFYIGLTVVYFDLRVRKGGFTLDTLSSQMGRTSA